MHRAFTAYVHIHTWVSCRILSAYTFSGYLIKMPKNSFLCKHHLHFKKNWQIVNHIFKTHWRLANHIFKSHILKLASLPFMISKELIFQKKMATRQSYFQKSYFQIGKFATHISKELIFQKKNGDSPIIFSKVIFLKLANLPLIISKELIF
ncbi:hypothetical protein Taro_018446 [Colocasia esculenta]|uniref:Uncharacterized protein n=1 Tax=Colocasia esculenta TaxID=4460 RepID=A0A843UTW2_COLES|nr:hypothetical protein [Colocasia esculenta]